MYIISLIFFICHINIVFLTFVLLVPPKKRGRQLLPQLKWSIFILCYCLQLGKKVGICDPPPSMCYKFGCAKKIQFKLEVTFIYFLILSASSEKHYLNLFWKRSLKISIHLVVRLSKFKFTQCHRLFTAKMKLNLMP